MFSFSGSLQKQKWHTGCSLLSKPPKSQQIWIVFSFPRSLRNVNRYPACSVFLKAFKITQKTYHVLFLEAFKIQHILQLMFSVLWSKVFKCLRIVAMFSLSQSLQNYDKYTLFSLCLQDFKDMATNGMFFLFQSFQNNEEKIYVVSASITSKYDGDAIYVFCLSLVNCLYIIKILPQALMFSFFLFFLKTFKMPSIPSHVLWSKVFKIDVMTPHVLSVSMSSKWR